MKELYDKITLKSNKITRLENDILYWKEIYARGDLEGSSDSNAEDKKKSSNSNQFNTSAVQTDINLKEIEKILRMGMQK